MYARRTLDPCPLLYATQDVPEVNYCPGAICGVQSYIRSRQSTRLIYRTLTMAYPKGVQLCHTIATKREC